MSDPIDQHYNTKFFLSAWAVEGYLWHHHSPYPQKIVAERKSPKAVGKQKHLNTLHGSHKPFELEKYLADHDNKASLILAKLRHQGNLENLSDEEKLIWSQMVIGCLERHPDRVIFRENLASTIIDDIKTNPSPLKDMIDDLDPRIINELFDPKVMGRVRLKSVMEDDEWIRLFGKMHWRLTMVPNTKSDRFITADKPVVRIDNEDGYVCALFFAISPTQLFSAFHTNYDVPEEDHKQFVDLHNLLIFKNEVQSIYSCDELTDDFVQRGRKINFIKAMKMHMKQAHWIVLQGRNS